MANIEGVAHRLAQVAEEIGGQNRQIGNLATLMATQGVGNIVPLFGGKRAEYREWVKSVEKYVTITGATEATAKQVAFQSARGVVSDFIGRSLKRVPGETWTELKRQLAARFGDVSDEQQAFVLLQKCRQKKEESVPLFAERLLSLAHEAFPEGIQGGAIQRQLVGFLIDGLGSSDLKMKVMRENPRTFDEAVNIANSEENLRRRFNLRVGREEPMEVDHIRNRKCFKCGNPNHQARDCRMVHAVQQTRLVCWNCREQGHVRRDCPLLKRRNNRGQLN